MRGVSSNRSPEESWDVDGLELAQSLVALLDSARSSGIAAVSAATSADFINAFSAQKSVVIVLAHWKGARLRGRDILADPSDLVTSIAEVQSSRFSSETLRFVLHRCRTCLDEILHLANPVERREHFASRLNDLIVEEAHILPGLLPPEVERGLFVGDIWLEVWHRNVLDVCANAKIVPGNQIEMRDGLQNPSDLVRQIPTSWGGLVDLTMCHSVIFGHLLKMGKSDRGILTRNKAVDPVLALTILRRLMIDIGTAKYNYAARYLEMFRETSKLVQDLFNVDNR